MHAAWPRQKRSHMDYIFEISVWLLDSGNTFLRFWGKLLYKIPRAYTKSLEKTRKGEEALEEEIEKRREDTWHKIMKSLGEE